MGFFKNIRTGYQSLSENVRDLKERKPFWKIMLNKYTLVSICFLVCICFIDRNSVGVLIRTEKTIVQQEEHISALESEISTLEQRINRLSSQKDTLEQFAREEYMFHEKDEDVFLSK